MAQVTVLISGESKAQAVLMNLDMGMLMEFAIAEEWSQRNNMEPEKEIKYRLRVVKKQLLRIQELWDLVFERDTV